VGLKVSSPCVDFCIYDYDADHCTGCGRTLEEISAWNHYDNKKRLEIIKKCKKRLDPDTELSYNNDSKGG
jgi:predicted Fe-S protein YdhL (DUF1289 family)